MTLTLLKATDKPLLEHGMAQRPPDYAEYVRRTSGFVPLRPERGD